MGMENNCQNYASWEMGLWRGNSQLALRLLDCAAEYRPILDLRVGPPLKSTDSTERKRGTYLFGALALLP